MSLRHWGAFTIELRRSRHLDNSDSERLHYKIESDCMLFLLRQDLQGHQIKVAGGRFKANNWRQICTEREIALGNPQDSVATWYLHGSRLEKKKRKKKKNTPQETLHAQMPPPVEEGGEVGEFSGVGCCVPALSHPSLWQSLLLPEFNVGWWLQTGIHTSSHPATPVLPRMPARCLYSSKTSSLI